MRFNAPEAKALYAELAPIITGRSVEGDAAAVTEALITHIETLTVDLGLPNRLKDMKVPEADLPMLARDGMKQNGYWLTTLAPSLKPMPQRFIKRLIKAFRL
jgi:alcohol dehydrogenase class IV